MHLLLLVDWTYPCDHQFLTTVYAENLVERGHELTWVMRSDDPDQRGIERETWNGSDVYVLPDATFDPIRNYARYRTNRMENSRLFATGVEFADVDVVHVRNDLSMGLAAATLSETHDVPLVHQISHLKAETLIEGAKRGVRTRADRVKGYLGKSLRGTVSDAADLVLPISESMRAYLVESGYDVPMEVLPTGATRHGPVPDPGPFVETYGIDREHALVYLGSMAPIRRLEFLFDVLDRLDDRRDVELLMVGGRSTDNVERLREAAAEAGVISNVTFTGWLDDRTEIRRAIAAADVGVSPLPTDSVLRTNAPIKTLEYMALGTPVVASATPDQRSVLGDSGAGVAVEYDPSAFADAIDDLLAASDRRRRMGSRGRDWIDTHRNFDVLTRKTERIYDRLHRNVA